MRDAKWNQLVDAYIGEANALRENFLALDPAALEALARTNKTVVFLCFTNRSGSNFLAELLSRTRRFNRAREVFNIPSIRTNLEKDTNVNNICEYIYTRAVAHKRLKFHVTKIASFQAAALFKFGILQKIPNLKFVQIERLDALSQSISYSIALQTKRWISSMKAETDTVNFDVQTISEYLDALELDFLAWRRLFILLDRIPFKVVYEQLRAHPTTVLGDLLADLGLEATKLAIENLETTVQSDLRNQAFKRKFLERAADAENEFLRLDATIAPSFASQVRKPLINRMKIWKRRRGG